MKRISAMFLALLMLFVSAACSDDSGIKEASDNKGNDIKPEAETVSDDVNDAEQYAPNLPDVNYNGYGFRIITRDDSMHPYPAHTRDIYAEEITGDSINDAVYNRNLFIEDTYGFKVIMESHNETVNEQTSLTIVSNSVMSNSDEYDLLLGHMLYTGNLATKKVLLNWELLDYIDFNKPYWNSNAHEAFSVGNKTFMALSDMCVSSNDNAHVSVFNKKLSDSFNTGNLYELVYSNEWTYDKFREIISEISSDMDGNGVYNEEDRYGYLIGGDSSLLNWMYAADCSVARKDENNYPILDLYNERTVAAYEWLYNLMQTKDQYMTTSWVETDGINMFKADKALIMSTQIMMFEHLRDMESNFGVLPFPKFDSAQENYAHYVDGHATVMAIPKTISDLERNAIFLEAMAYESHKSVLPIYYDVVLTTKYMRDEDSRNMLELVYNSRAFDFAYVYDNFSLSFCFKRAKDNADFTSYYKGMEKIEQKLFEQIAKAYDKAE